MTKVINKKKLTRCLATAGFFVLLLSGSFLFCEETLAVGDYTKVPTATLSAGEWNGLMTDYVNTWKSAIMVGPLGIGTTNPNGKLDVGSPTGVYRTTLSSVANFFGADVTRGQVALYSTDAAAVNKGGSFSFGGENTVGAGGTSPYIFGQIKGAKEGAANTYNGYLSFSTVDATSGIFERMRIDSAGKVGIGTTAPNDIFSIGNSGSAPAGSPNTGHNFTSTYLGSDDYALTNYGLVKTLISSATSSISTLWAGVTSGHIWNLNTGNIGIGTSSPLFKLEVSGTFKVSTSSSSIILDSGGNVLIGI